MSHTWPGNIRELRNVVEFAMALADGPIIGVTEVAEALGAHVSVAPRDDWVCTRQRLMSVLAECGGDTARVADHLGLHRSNVYRMMRRLGISTPRRQRLQNPLADEIPPGVASPREFALFAFDDANSPSVRANPQ
jgi:DNA-binding NtrC family response regulator